MKTDIILAGVGGQGILSIAAVIGKAAINSQLHIKQAEVHGMSQRGGSVYSHLRLSDRPVVSDLIPTGQADIILSVEPMEALRYLPMLSADGWVITSTDSFVNIDNYPDGQMLKKALNAVQNLIPIDANKIATDCGNLRASNMVMLGAAIPFLNMKMQAIEQAVASAFERKGNAVVNMNISAIKAGCEAAIKARQTVV